MKLYKYFPDSVYSFKSLSVRGLWCHFPKKMNDPADCLGYLDRELSHESLSEFKAFCSAKDSPLMQRFANMPNDKVCEFVNLQRRNLIDRFAFCSLSESFDDVMMWSHYASSHTGFVIEFEFDENSIDHHFQKIRYVDHIPDFEIIKLAEFQDGKDEYIHYLFEDISIKASAWEKEKEWRIWRSSPCYYHYEPESIKNVYFGVNASIETKAVVVKLVGALHENALYHFMEFSQKPIKLIYKS